MIVDPQSISPGSMYRFMIGVVVPRPIAFVSTASAQGRFNVAPFSYFNALTNRPPLLGISINLRGGAPKDTLRNIRETGDFVVNIVNEDLFARMVQTSGDWPEEVNEFQLTGLTPAPSDLVKAPRVAESPVNMECRLYKEVELGDSAFVVGEILRAHVSDFVLTDGRVDVVKLKPIGRLGGDQYAPLREVLSMPRPKVGGASSGGGS
jgi:flavin reductase (DIM6/NTAB) family NADH-FMN oxidoreductase RutF